MTQTPMQELLQWLGEKELTPTADHIRRVFLEKERGALADAYVKGYMDRGYDRFILSSYREQFLKKIYGE